MSLVTKDGLARTGRREVPVAAAALVAWAGLVVHNVADLPGQTLLSPESAVPGLVSLVLVTLWFLPRTGRISGWLLLGWALLNLIGGAVLSVLPLPVLPFVPEQSLRHYLFHLLYGLCQVPLVVALTHAGSGAER